MKQKQKKMDKFYFELFIISICTFLYGYDPENTNYIGIATSLIGMLCLYIFSVVCIIKVKDEYKSFLKYILLILNLIVGITVTTTQNLGMRDLALMLLLSVAVFSMAYKYLSWIVLIIALVGPFISSKFIFSYGLIIIALCVYSCFKNKDFLSILYATLSTVLMVAMTIYRYPIDFEAWRHIEDFSTVENIEKLIGIVIAFSPLIVLSILLFVKFIKSASKKAIIIVVADCLVLTNFALTNRYGNVTYEIVTCVLLSIVAILMDGDKEDTEVFNNIGIKWKEKNPWYYLLVIYVLTLLPFNTMGSCAVASKISDVCHQVVALFL